jgi:hypothetical protein
MLCKYLWVYIRKCICNVIELLKKIYIYVGYPESKFRWAIGKEARIYFQTIYIAVWYTYRALLFDIVSTIVEALVVAGHQFVSLYRRMMPPSLSDTISWRSDREICGKCRESDEMVNRLFSWIYSPTARTKSSLTTGGRPLRTFPRPSIKCLTHLRAIETRPACSLYASQSWRWMSAGFMFLAFKKRTTDRISDAAGFSTFLNIVNTQDDV